MSKERVSKAFALLRTTYLKAIGMKYAGYGLIELIKFVYLFAGLYVPQDTICKAKRVSCHLHTH